MKLSRFKLLRNLQLAARGCAYSKIAYRASKALNASSVKCVESRNIYVNIEHVTLTVTTPPSSHLVVQCCVHFQSVNNKQQAGAFISNCKQERKSKEKKAICNYY